LGPLVHVGALLDGGAALLLVIPATVRVPSFQAPTGMNADNSSVGNFQKILVDFLFPQRSAGCLKIVRVKDFYSSIVLCIENAGRTDTEVQGSVRLSIN